jgi:hypothetical protein
LKDIVYTVALSSWDGTRRDAAKRVGFSVVAILLDPEVDLISNANIAELKRISSQLRSQG